MPDLPTAADFQAHIGTLFSVSDRPDTLQLIAVETHVAPRGAARSPFTVFFQSRRDELLPEGFYRIVAEAGPAFELYIIPILTPPGDRQEYQSVFN
jgi:hypothetical protein